MWDLLILSVVVLDTAHVVSPMVLSWTHAGFRRVMLDAPVQYILLPLGVFAIGVGVTLATCMGLTPYVPDRGVFQQTSAWATFVKFYWMVNFWHFAMQNFGWLQLMRPARRLNLLVAFIGTVIGMWVAPLMLAVHHWVTDLWLSHRAAGRRKWAYSAVVVALALCGAWLLLPISFQWERPLGLPPSSRHPATALLVFLIGFRLALGLNHFAGSVRLWPRVWRLSES